MKLTAVDAAQIMDRYKSIWIDGKIDLMDRVFAPNVIRHQPVSVRPPEVDGREAYRAYIIEFRGLHPDLRVEIVDVIVAGDKIAYRYNASAFIDESRTKRFSYTGITIVQLDAKGRIAEEWLTWDTFDLLVQVGAVSPREA